MSGPKDTLFMCALLLQAEAKRGRGLHGQFNSMHEGYAVVLEELDEAWTEIKRNDRKRAVAEMVQVGAMALRFVHEYGDRDTRDIYDEAEPPAVPD